LYHLHDEEGNPSAVFQAKDNANVPFVAFGALDSTDREDIFGHIGYHGGPQIAFGPKVGYERQLPLVDVALLTGTLQLANLDLSELAGNLPIPVVESLDGLIFGEGTLFMLRVGTDSGALYLMTRWGPEPQSGYHTAGLHDHHVDTEGGQLAQANTHQAPDTDGGVSSLHHTLGSSAFQAAAGDHSHLVTDAMIYFGIGAEMVSAGDVPLADVGEYFVTPNVEAGMRYLVDWLWSIEGRLA
jgi:hypothetical protein